MKKIITIMLIFVLSILIVSSHGEETFAEAEELIESKIACDQLTDEQLEIVGDYYMEQMHPGEEHETMDEMMGGEGSENLRLMHINMAKSFYCGEHDVMSSGMMNMMMGRNMGMMSSKKISMMGGENKMAYGIMGNTWGVGGSLFKVVYLALAAFIFSVIFWLTHNWLVKGKKKRK